MEFRGRAATRLQIQMKNRKRIKEFFDKYPLKMQMEAAEELGLTKNTISRHVRALREEAKKKADGE